MKNLVQKHWFIINPLCLESVMLPDNRKLEHAFRVISRIANLKTFQVYKLTITSGRDGLHSERSKHYIDHAIDIRIKDYDGDLSNISAKDMKLAKEIVKEAQEELGEDYWLLLHSTHIHLEYCGQPLRYV